MGREQHLLDQLVPSVVFKKTSVESIDALLEAPSVGLPGRPLSVNPDDPEYQAWVTADRLLLSSLPVEEVNRHFVEVHEFFRNLPGASSEQRAWVQKFTAGGQDLLRLHKGLEVSEEQILRNNPLVPIIS